jgi:hypothetical protein
MIERHLLKAGVGAQWYRHASIACLALGGGVFLLAYGRWWSFAILLSTVAAGRFALRRGIEGNMALLFLGALGFAIFLATR